jgi:hypothetical protein
MQNDVQLSIAQQEDKKQSYEKPTLGTVRLFADQVLTLCSGGSPCVQQPPYSST